MKIIWMTVMGLSFLAVDHSLEYDDQVLLMRIRETQRRANVGGVVHEPGNRAMADIPVDDEFSKMCCQVWK